MIFSKRPLQLYRRPDLYMNAVPGKGRGVFCASAVLAGEILEVTPIMMFNEADSAKLSETVLADYVFTGRMLPPDMAARAGILDAGKAVCLVMGIASYCNHRTVPNATRSLENEYHTAFFVLRAKEDIAPDSEICIDYGAAWFINKKLNKLAKLLGAKNPGKDNLT